MGPGGVWWSNVLNLALPPQRLRSDTGQSTKTLSATWLECLHSWRSWPAVALFLHCTLESPASSLFCPKASVPQTKTVSLKIVTVLRWLFFSFVLSWVSLAPRGLRAEASHPAFLTRVPSAEWLPPTPPPRQAVCRSVANDTAVQDGSRELCAEKLHMTGQSKMAAGDHVYYVFN